MLDAVLAFILSYSALLMIHLALFSALMAFRAGAVNERLLFELMSVQSWELQQAFEHGFLYRAFIFFALFRATAIPPISRRRCAG